MRTFRTFFNSYSIHTLTVVVIFCLLSFVFVFSSKVRAKDFLSYPCSNCKNGICPIDSGDLAGVTEIPEILKPIFTAAGNAHQVSPAFIAAIYWKEHGKSFPTDGPFACSPMSACGPFQFIPSTWAGYAEDGNGDGVADIQNIWDAAFAGSALLGANGAAPNVADLEALRDSASRYNSGQPWSVGQGYEETADYVPDVIDAYLRFISQVGG